MGAIGTSLLLLAVMTSAPAVMTGLHRLLMAGSVVWADPVVGLRWHGWLVRRDRRHKRYHRCRDDAESGNSGTHDGLPC